MGESTSEDLNHALLLALLCWNLHPTLPANSWCFCGFSCTRLIVGIMSWLLFSEAAQWVIAKVGSSRRMADCRRSKTAHKPMRKSRFRFLFRLVIIKSESFPGHQSTITKQRSMLYESAFVHPKKTGVRFCIQCDCTVCHPQKYSLSFQHPPVLFNRL